MLSDNAPQAGHHGEPEIEIMFHVLDSQRVLLDVAIEKQNHRLAKEALRMINATCACLDKLNQ
jgi:hypothetical protein